MGQHLVKRDLFPGIGAPGDIFAQLVFDVQLSLGLQYHNRHSSEFFGDIWDAKPGLRRDLGFIGLIGITIALAEQHFSLVGDQHRT